MPANPKYLTQSTHQRIAKITAAILGGYILSSTIHLALTGWLDRGIVLMTSSFTNFILWVSFMVIAFLGRNGWKTWAIYLFCSAVLLGITYLGKTYNPA